MHPAAQAQAPAGRPKRLGEEIAQRHLTSSERLGESVRRHVDQYIARSGVSEHVKQHILAAVKELEEEIREEFGSGQALQEAASAVKSKHTARQDVAKLFRTPAGARQAIIASEILGKPKALRR